MIRAKRPMIALAGIITALSMLGAAPASALAAESEGGEPVEMYRLYNPNSGEHFYTAQVAERNHLVVDGWTFEGVGWQAPSAGKAVYRLYNPNTGDHHYTANAEESHDLVVNGWTFEGIGWQAGGDTDVYREYNPNAATGAHNFTTSAAEGEALVGVGWTDEGVAWQASGAGRSLTQEEDDLVQALHDLTGAIDRGREAYERALLVEPVGDDLRLALSTAMEEGEAAIASPSASEVQAAIDAIDGAIDPIEQIFETDPVEKMIDWAISIADDDSHGYSQDTRYGNPNYDCSSLVYFAATHAGWDLGRNDPGDNFWTGNEPARLQAAGWTRAGGVELTAENGLKRGDILMVHNAQRQHTEIYIGNGQTVGARGGNKDHKDGDSLGIEISVTDLTGWYTDVYRWERPKSA